MRIKSVLLTLFLCVSCEKTENLYIKDCLSDKGVSATISGTLGENELNETLSLILYKTYDDSQISSYDTEAGYSIKIARFTKDFQSYIRFYLTFDQNFEVVKENCFFEYDLNIIKDNKIIRVISFHIDYKDVVINNLSYDTKSGNLVFEYSIECEDDDSDYTITGKANVKLYQYE